MSESNKPSDNKTPAFCTKCNNFYASANFGGLCSGCFGKIQGKGKKEEKQLADTKKVEELDSTLKYQGENKGIQEDKQRCFQCKKKVRLLGTQCKCNYVFCNSHRMPEDHNCTYKFEEQGKDHLKKEIKKVEQSKQQGIDV